MTNNCAVEDIVVVNSTSGDASESYEFEARGHRVTLACLAPDFECFLAP